MENHEISSNVNDDVIINIMPITNLLCDNLERADIMKELIPKQEIMDNTVDSFIPMHANFGSKMDVMCHTLLDVDPLDDDFKFNTESVIKIEPLQLDSEMMNVFQGHHAPINQAIK